MEGKETIGAILETKTCQSKKAKRRLDRLEAGRDENSQSRVLALN